MNDRRTGQRKATPIDEHVGRRIRARRNDNRLNLETVANAIGCSTQQLRKYETGENRASAGVLHRLGRALGVRPSYFFAESEFIQDDLAVPTLVSGGDAVIAGFAEGDADDEGDAAIVMAAAQAVEDEDLRRTLAALARLAERSVD
ncbi:MAG: helix-turn-helix transcriptional regulator [Pseudomonadota bacterium]